MDAEAVVGEAAGAGAAGVILGGGAALGALGGWELVASEATSTETGMPQGERYDCLIVCNCACVCMYVHACVLYVCVRICMFDCRDEI